MQIKLIFCMLLSICRGVVRLYVTLNKRIDKSTTHSLNLYDRLSSNVNVTCSLDGDHSWKTLSMMIMMTDWVIGREYF